MEKKQKQKTGKIFFFQPLAGFVSIHKILKKILCIRCFCSNNKVLLVATVLEMTLAVGLLW